MEQTAGNELRACLVEGHSLWHCIWSYRPVEKHNAWTRRGGVTADRCKHYTKHTEFDIHILHAVQWQVLQYFTHSILEWMLNVLLTGWCSKIWYDSHWEIHSFVLKIMFRKLESHFGLPLQRKWGFKNTSRTTITRFQLGMTWYLMDQLLLD